MPPTRTKSTTGELYVRHHNTGDHVRLSQDGGGLASATGGSTTSLRRMPSSGDFATFQLTGYDAAGMQIAVDENEITHPLFWFASGMRFDVRWDPEGTATGRPRYSFEAVASVAWQAAEGGVRGFAVVLPADGSWTATAIPDSVDELAA